MTNVQQQTVLVDIPSQLAAAETIPSQRAAAGGIPLQRADPITLRPNSGNLIPNLQESQAKFATRSQSPEYSASITVQ